MPKTPSKLGPTGITSIYDGVGLPESLSVCSLLTKEILDIRVNGIFPLKLLQERILKLWQLFYRTPSIGPCMYLDALDRSSI